MAKTYGNILFETRGSLGLRADQGVGMSHLNDAFRLFWDLHPWKETLGRMEPFYVVPGWSIYNKPFINIPDDFRDLYSAELVEIYFDGTLESRSIEVYGNMKPGRHMGQVEAMGFSFEFNAFLLDAIPNQHVGIDYILPIYKKDYPLDLTAEGATSNKFPFTRNEGFFKVVLGWHLRGKQEQEYQMVMRAFHGALLAETPGKQAHADTPESLFSELGSY